MPRDEARRLLAQGNQRLAVGKCAQALESYQQAKRLVPASYKIEVNLATAYECLGQRVRAVEHLQLFLAQSDVDADREMRARVEGKLQLLDARLARLTVACEIDGAEVLVDQVAIGWTPIRRVRIEPGLRSIVVRKAGFEDFTVEVRARAGESARVQVPWRKRAAAATRSASTPSRVAPRVAKTPLTPPLVKGSAAEDRRTGTSPTTKSIWTRWWFWAALGVVAGATAAWMIAARSGGDDRLPGGELITIRQE